MSILFDYTHFINSLSCPEKEKAQLLIAQFFDIEQNENRKFVKHWVFDDCLDAVYSQKELMKKLNAINSGCWSRVLLELNKKEDLFVAKERAWNERYQTKKVCKISYCTPLRFNTVGVKEDELKVYCHVYEDGSMTEITGEINFVVEFY